MARNVLTDFLQDNHFWLMDVGIVSGQPAIPIFNPLAGFSAISAPEITLEMADITEGNSLFRKKVVKRGDVGSITLSRGSTFWDADFYRWTMTALTGDTQVVVKLQGKDTPISQGGPSPRRDLLLIHYFRLAVPVVQDAVGTVNSLQSAISFTAPKIPARAWLLKGCIPTRYKSGGDFDAASGQISIMELEVAVESMEEISLAQP